ncbi:hypothetical protein SNE40_011317 [Patella caerulea]|uniref:Uncharacterized protein n=1 Tax=Patella caerulea TaxID=87958 RepID=A0AAN8JP33_PATCE
MTSVGVMFITLAVGVCWLESVKAQKDRCVSAYYDRQHAVSFFGDHSDWKYGFREEINEESGYSKSPNKQCVRVRDRKLENHDSNKDLHQDNKDNLNKNNIQQQKTPATKYKGSKRKRKREKQKKLRRKKNNNHVKKSKGG